MQRPPATEAKTGLGILLFLMGAGCVMPSLPPSSPPAARPFPQGQVVHSEPGRRYAIVDFDLRPDPGQVFWLVNAEEKTATIQVTGRRIGSNHAVNILEGRPKAGDYVAAPGRKAASSP